MPDMDKDSALAWLDQMITQFITAQETAYIAAKLAALEGVTNG